MSKETNLVESRDFTDDDGLFLHFPIFPFHYFYYRFSLMRSYNFSLSNADHEEAKVVQRRTQKPGAEKNSSIVNLADRK